MSKKYTVAVSDKVLVPVEGKTSDENGKSSPFKFSLVCERLDAEVLKEELENKEESAATMMKKITSAWRDQRLVLEQDGTPAEFCDEAMDELLKIAGMAMQCLNAYLKEVGVKAKN